MKNSGFIVELIIRVTSRLIITFPILLVVYSIYGVNYEHGDSNAGGMYAIVMAPAGLLLAIIATILFYITDAITARTKINFVKNFTILLLLLGDLWFTGLTRATINLTVLTIAILNIIVELYHLIPDNRKAR